MARIILVCSIAILILLSSDVSGANLSLAWNPSASANVAGYTLYYGVASGRYTSGLGVGTNTNITVTGLTPGQTYYFVTTAYNIDGLESPYSNAVTNTVPALPLVQAQPLSQTAVVGTIVVLSVAVGSTTPVSFQWFVGGVALTGATNSLLLLPQISEANAGAYTVVASNAGGNVTSHVAVLSVVNLVAPPPVPAQAGVYNGLFYQTSAAGVAIATEATTGFISSCTIGTNGAYSARLFVGGQPFTCSGVLKTAGEISTVAYPGLAGLPNLSVTLYADAALGPERLTGVVSNMNPANPWVAPLSAILQTNVFSPATNFLFLSPPPAGQLGTNQTCLVTLSANGAVLLSGQLGDGASIWQAGYIGADGSFPVYQSLYNNTGLLAGWITFAEGAPTGNLIWIQPTNTQGFTNTISFGAEPGSSTNRFQLMP
jgi:hypothetical protein